MIINKIYFMNYQMLKKENPLILSKIINKKMIKNKLIIINKIIKHMVKIIYNNK